MKVGVLFRGPLRPNSESVSNCIKRLTEDLNLIGITPTTVVATWNDEVNLAGGRILLDKNVNNIVLLRTPDRQFMGDDLYDGTFAHGGSRRNTFLQFYMSKIAINFLTDLDDFGWIVHARTDAIVDFGAFLGEWFSEINDHNYRTIHVHGFINDQFAVARPAVMRKAWDHGSLDDLRSKIRGCTQPEFVLQDMLDLACIVPVTAPIVRIDLNPHRHLSSA